MGSLAIDDTTGARVSVMTKKASIMWRPSLIGGLMFYIFALNL